MGKLQSKWEKLSAKTQNIAKFVSAVLVFIGAISSLCGFIQKSVHEVITFETAGLQAQIDNNQKKSEELERQILMATSRSEIMNLIQNYPDHIESIKTAGRYYFQDLHGDSYVHAIFYEWCKEYDLDACAIAVNN